MKKNILFVWAFLCSSLISYAQFSDNVDLTVFALGKDKSDAIEKAKTRAVAQIFSDLISSAEVPESISEVAANTPFDLVLEAEDNVNSYGAVLLDVHVSTTQIHQWAIQNKINPDYVKSQTRWSRILPEYSIFNRLQCAMAFKAIIPYYAIDAFNYNLIVQPLEASRDRGIIEISVEYFANEKTAAFDKLVSKMLERLYDSNDKGNWDEKVLMPVYVNEKRKNVIRYIYSDFSEKLACSVFQPYTLVFENSRVFRHNPEAYYVSKEVTLNSSCHYPTMFAGEMAKKQWKYDGLLFVITSSFNVPLSEYDRMSNETIQINRNPFESICIEGLVYSGHDKFGTTENILKDASNESMASGYYEAINWTLLNQQVYQKGLPTNYDLEVNMDFLENNLSKIMQVAK